MESVREIQSALEHLPSEQKWEVAEWLLQELHETSQTNGTPLHLAEPAQPDYTERRKQIFGDKVLPNFVLLARNEERW